MSSLAKKIWPKWSIETWKQWFGEIWQQRFVWSIPLAIVFGLAANWVTSRYERYNYEMRSCYGDLVQDDGGFLLNDRLHQSLQKEAKDVACELGAEIGIWLTFPEPGVDLFERSLDKANTWRLGRKKINDGILITYVPKTHESRMEVGSGLSHVLTDARATQLLEQYLDREKAVSTQIDALMSAVVGELRGAMEDGLLVRPQAPRRPGVFECLLTAQLMAIVAVILFYVRILAGGDNKLRDPDDHKCSEPKKRYRWLEKLGALVNLTVSIVYFFSRFSTFPADLFRRVVRMAHPHPIASRWLASH